jgi:hypothetical protein
VREQDKTTIGRRQFFRALGVGTMGAVAAAGPLAEKAVADSESNEEKRKARYKETDEVKTYYRVNRYPG